MFTPRPSEVWMHVAWKEGVDQALILRIQQIGDSSLLTLICWNSCLSSWFWLVSMWVFLLGYMVSMMDGCGISCALHCPDQVVWEEIWEHQIWKNFLRAHAPRLTYTWRAYACFQWSALPLHPSFFQAWSLVITQVSMQSQVIAWVVVATILHSPCIKEYCCRIWTGNYQKISCLD